MATGSSTHWVVQNGCMVKSHSDQFMDTFKYLDAMHHVASVIMLYPADRIL
jgi:hypothetical protein